MAEGMGYKLDVQERLLAQQKSHYHREVTMSRLLNAACELPPQLQTKYCKAVCHCCCLLFYSGIWRSATRSQLLQKASYSHDIASPQDRTLASAVVSLSICMQSYLIG